MTFDDIGMILAVVGIALMFGLGFIAGQQR
jgi:hypothetical protein